MTGLRARVPFSRPCYDKYHRCPGWAGGGMKCARAVRCDGGYVGRDAAEAGGWNPWRPYRCDTCRLLVLPSHVRWADPGWLRFAAGRRVRDLL